MSDEPIQFAFENAPHPLFRDWLSKQPEDVVAAINAKREDLKTHPDIDHAHRNAEYARLTFLMQWCAAEYGYEYGS